MDERCQAGVGILVSPWLSASGRLFRLEYLAFLSVLVWLEELGHMEEL